jgi:hypothetical protein
MKSRIGEVCARLGVSDSRFVEIEAKRKVRPDQVEALREHLRALPGVRHRRTSVFFDQFLDTSRLELLARGASLRLRYKSDGAHVYLQYKGPGFEIDGVLYRSEFSSSRLDHLVREESHHDIVHFSDTTVHEILADHVEPAMADAMRAHLGAEVVGRIATGPILSLYRKDKFEVDLGDAMLEPSLDRIMAFHINNGGMHSLSTFSEYENEVKSPRLAAKLAHLGDLVKFDKKLERRFDLKPEPLSKYHRSASCFLPVASRN